MFRFRQSIPALPDQGFTKLDKNLRNYRIEELVGTACGCTGHFY